MDIKFKSHASAAYILNIPCVESIDGLNDKGGNEEYTVTSRKLRYKRKGHTVHLCTSRLPEGSVIIKNGEYVSSPEMVFLQLSLRLKKHDLIKLGLLLCSHSVNHPEEALTTKKKILNFLKQAHWYRGIGKQ